ncbi:MAG: hypothetical protein A2268_10995 [Candidatus Raymondbacteria bacterium RifOxyA12_full_50_37]|uniref:Glycosyltransferase 2-like domain-containing protein n=1 Tax=Candidatus Raymondbacteria bacterium RIFOXYD12_FULL_49_13 TaxID=1817890 RepID=A0A1F7F218_UNCRA|nr:MAG: hypothetical protein A2268_10995 [Candidatus Raymondbacteria bacterium RifOxyA12_full_50_37]OGJ85537.1 MAG: hypothetical protein A2248_12780 [Candidatus Raymondbacteria bacterium RIFOXYA2_FULL_49_16]OGJ94671.1 MAG: hypothetical protein A2487_08005 [Candidatus Raymondbacteria bacterium RifOxyC12_full_50_8]OGJ95040.1 MAG: hypothetical protein A2453_07480 [Candidatus Raymondbacteria bacterium RIFOXYC2_FULL_50_21]OGK00704.1 MAG: hypothetical protein A2519_20125 [Candidatus Raymondbacteria b
MPKTITVIVPTYNRASLLERLVDSLRRQSIDQVHVDLLFVNDGSMDNTERVLKDLGIACITIPHAGPAGARNAGAAAAQTPVLAFLDDDVYPDRDWLKIIYLAYQEGGLHGAIEGDVVSKGEPVPLSHTVLHQGPGGYLSCNFAITKETFEKTGGFDVFFKYPMNEDFDFFLRLKKRAPVTYVPGMVVFHPVYPRPFFKTLLSSFAFARQTISAEYLLNKNHPEAYRMVKFEPNALATIARLSRNYFFHNVLKNPGMFFKHPIRALMWAKICFFRHLGFIYYRIRAYSG